MVYCISSSSVIYVLRVMSNDELILVIKVSFHSGVEIWLTAFATSQHKHWTLHSRIKSGHFLLKEHLTPTLWSSVRTLVLVALLEHCLCVSSTRLISASRVLPTTHCQLVKLEHNASFVEWPMCMWRPSRLMVYVVYTEVLSSPVLELLFTEAASLASTIHWSPLCWVTMLVWLFLSFLDTVSHNLFGPPC